MVDELSACYLTLMVRIGYVANVAMHLPIEDMVKIVEYGISFSCLYLRKAILLRNS